MKNIWENPANKNTNGDFALTFFFYIYIYKKKCNFTSFWTIIIVVYKIKLEKLQQINKQHPKS